MTAVYWFNHAHEDRNDWLRLGLMRLHVARQIHFEERSLAHAGSSFKLAPELVQHKHRHTSVLIVEADRRSQVVIVDNEDSFFCLTSIIQHADVYFCGGYSRRFFEDGTFQEPFGWQSEPEVCFYRQRAKELLDLYGDHFSRVRPFAPIGPNLHYGRKVPWIEQRIKNAYHRVSAALQPGVPWLLRHSDFEARYRFLLSLREAQTRFDIVLQDTLWGWPRHRERLHRKLRSLSLEGDHAICSRLRWQDPMTLDGGTSYPLLKSDYPIEVGTITDYESMLASSRLGVFATGFHYGWRNIVTLAMMLGLPIYCDPFLIDHMWNRQGYTFYFNDSGDWSDLERLLQKYRDPNRLLEAKRANRELFDRNLSPEIVARQLLEAVAMSGHHAPKQVLA